MQLSLRRAKLKCNVFPLYIVKFPQSLPEFVFERLRIREAYVERAYLSHLELLRARRERPRCSRAGEQRDELAPSQLIELHLIPTSQDLARQDILIGNKYS